MAVVNPGRSGLFGFLRDTLREWRSPELRVLAAALAIAVGAVAAVGFFTDRVDRGMAQQASTLLGGDLAAVSDTAIPERWMEQAERFGLIFARSASLPSVLFTEEDESVLVSVRAVDSQWPLRGHVELADDPVPARRGHGPETGAAWGDGALLQALGLAPGATVELGRLPLRLDAQILLEPDRGSSLFEIAPRVLIHFDDLARSGLIGPGSRVRYQLLVAGPPGAVQGFRSWLESELRPGQRLLDLEDANPELREAIRQGRRFLGLASLMAVLLAGAAIAVAAHHFADRRADAAAILRALGASRLRVLRTYFLRVLAIAALASGLGLAAGFAAQFALGALLEEWLAAPLPPAGWRPVFSGLGVGLVTACGFALPALLRIGQVSPLRVLRQELGLPPVSVWLSALLAVLTFGALLFWQAGDPTLATWVLAGTGAALLVLALTGWGMVAVLRPLRDRGGMALRFGLANLARRGTLSTVQIVAFGVGILALLLLGIVRVDLLSSWQRNLPADAPNYFFINIQPGDETGFADRVASSGLPRPEVDPMIRGRLVAINGRPVSASDFSDDRARRLLEREFNLSHAEHIPTHNRLATGRWFTPESFEEWSVESGLMERFSLRLGDELTFRVAGVPVQGRITSVRDVDWDSFRVNFFVIGPSALLAGQPRTYITSLNLPPEMEAEKNRWLREFPAVTAIDVTALLAQVRSVMEQAARAVEYVFLFTLLAGLTVLYAAVQATQDIRRRESSLLRALGARRPQIRNALLAEFGALGLLAGLLAAIAATAVGALLSLKVFGFPFLPNPMIFVVGVGGGALGIGLAGWLGTRGVLRQAPLQVLRGSE